MLSETAIAIVAGEARTHPALPELLRHEHLAPRAVGTAGPGCQEPGTSMIVDGTRYNTDAVASTLLDAAGLPAPFEARDPAITAWFN